MDIDGPGTRVTIYVGESDRWEGRTLYEAIVKVLRREGCAGATVFKGEMGFGKSSRIHSANILRLSEDLPVAIVFVDSPERVDAVMPRLDAMVTGGMIVVEDVHIHKYSHAGE